MNMNCYVCDNDSCQTHFAVDSLSDNGGATCPNCGDEVTDTGEVMIDPEIIGKLRATNAGRI